MEGPQKKWPSHSRLQTPQQGNEERLHASVESSSSLETSAAWVALLDGESSRPPAVLPLLAGSLNQNPICLYFLFSAGSPCGCSFDGQVQRSRVSAQAPFWVCAHALLPADNTWNASLLHFAVDVVDGRMGKKELQPSASFVCLLLSSAGLCGATDAAPRLRLRREGAKEELRTHQQRETDGFLCLDPIGRNTPAQFSKRLSPLLLLFLHL